jgi:hypothetical protein
VLGGIIFDASNSATESVEDFLTRLVKVSGAKGYTVYEPTNRGYFLVSGLWSLIGLASLRGGAKRDRAFEALPWTHAARLASGESQLGGWFGDMVFVLEGQRRASVDVLESCQRLRFSAKGAEMYLDIQFHPSVSLGLTRLRPDRSCEILYPQMHPGI